jgi:hypothetical protein
MSVVIIAAYYTLLAVQLALVLAAFQTSLKLGVMAFFLPMYVVSFGNWRLKTQHRRHLAIAWWLGLAGFALAVAVAP